MCDALQIPMDCMLESEITFFLLFDMISYMLMKFDVASESDRGTSACKDSFSLLSYASLFDFLR